MPHAELLVRLVLAGVALWCLALFAQGAWRRAHTAAALRGRRCVRFRWGWDGDRKRVMRELPAGWWVYRQRDRRDVVKYVGRTSNLRDRFNDEGDKYQSAAWHHGEAYACRNEADAAALEHLLWSMHNGLDNKIKPSAPGRRKRTR